MYASGVERRHALYPVNALNELLKLGGGERLYVLRLAVLYLYAGELASRVDGDKVRVNAKLENERSRD
jgi:hypothetical protein